MSEDQQADQDDKHLVRRIQAGDESAFEELIERYNKRIKKFCFGKIADVPAAWQLAEDLAQETWIRVKRGIATFCEKETCRFSTWVFRIAKNEVISNHRNRTADIRDPGTDFVPLDCDGQEVQIPAPDAASPLDHAITPETERRIREAIEQLPEKEKEVITLRYLEELTVRRSAEKNLPAPISRNALASGSSRQPDASAFRLIGMFASAARLKETAEAMKLKEKQVEYLTFKARESLRKSLGDDQSRSAG